VTFAPSVNTDASIPSLDMTTDSDGVVRADESTKAVSVLGLNMSSDGAADSSAANASTDDLPALEISTGNTNPGIPTPGATPPPPKPVTTTPTPPGVNPEGAGPDQSSFNGITAEIPADAIWLIKQNNSESVSGPFKFLDVVKLLELGKISKNDKISRTGTNRFNKISQQYGLINRYNSFYLIFNYVKKI
jgi:hypothetical protein